MTIKTGFWRRLFWVTAMNLALLTTLLVLAEVSGEEAPGIIVFFVLYTFTTPLFHLGLSRYYVKKMYDMTILDPKLYYNPKYNWYIETVRNICDKAGMKKLPEIAVYEDSSFNAFATGRSKNSSMVAVSSGMLDHMSPPAIESVIAHEVAHIMNGDMVTQTLIDATLKGVIALLLLPLTVLKWIALFSYRNDTVWIFYLLYIIETALTFILFFFASLITKAFSRSREFQADLLSAKLTNPSRMIQALKELDEAVVPRHQHANISRLFNGPSRFWDIFSTHPSIARRVRYIQDNSFHSVRKPASVFSWKLLFTVAITATVVFFFTRETDIHEAETPRQPIEATNSQTFIIEQSSNQYLSAEDIIQLSPSELRIARNEIYARHGYPFQSADLQQYFAGQDWYTIDYQFSEHSFSAIEKANIQLIKVREDNYSSVAIDSSKFENYMEEYVQSMVDAINYRDYTIVSRFIKSGSPLEQAQTKLVRHLEAKGVTEHVNYIDIRNVKQLSAKLYEVIVFESIYVTNPDKTYLTEQLWAYRLSNGEHGFQLTEIKAN